MPDARRDRSGRRALTLTLAVLAVLLGLAPSAVQAGSSLANVSGNSFLVLGVTTQKSSFGDPIETAGSLEVSFDDTTFSSNAVSGDYVRQGDNLRLQVDPARLTSYEASWEQAFRASLGREGLDPDTVDCAVQQARVKGAIRGNGLKLKTKYRLRCLAQGAFGERKATAMVRFQGRGPVRPVLGSPGVIYSPVAGLPPGQAGLYMQVAVGIGGSAGLDRQVLDYSWLIQSPPGGSVDVLAAP